MPYRINSQRALRAEFWRTHLDVSRKRIKNYAGNGTMYPTDTRCAFADWLDSLSRNAEISQALARRATLS